MRVDRRARIFDFRPRSHFMPSDVSLLLVTWPSCGAPTCWTDHDLIMMTMIPRAFSYKSATCPLISAAVSTSRMPDSFHLARNKPGHIAVAPREAHDESLTPACKSVMYVENCVLSL